MKAPVIFVILAFIGSQNIGLSKAAFCEIFAPLKGAENEGPQFGFIFVPGAQIKGEFYGPLSMEIQRLFPGNMWIGLTEGWLGNFPNPLEIDGAIKDCFKIAQDSGLATDHVFQAGHSLGGIMLEQWAKDNAELSKGIILFGSYLPNGFFGNGDTNVFPVPVLTAVGSLDGGALSYVAREARESKDPILEGKYPVYVIDQVNHGQVASGEMPSIVIEQDIDAEVSNEEAWTRYAEAAVAFMVTSTYENFSPEVVGDELLLMEALQDFTDEFLRPFEEMRKLEQNDEGTSSPWVIAGQHILSNIPLKLIGDQAEVTNELVAFSDIGGVKPSFESSNCTVKIKTYGHNSHPFDPLDFGGLISADVIKAKFKLEDIVLEGLCQDQAERNQCKDINEEAFNLALEASDEISRQRFLQKGRKLVFVNDYVSPWGPGWEFSGGLDYKKIDERHVELMSTSLISEPDFIIESAAGMHYCDLLSPYRALEWIYITGVQHGN